jgi:hypothetical protein
MDAACRWVADGFTSGRTQCQYRNHFTMADRPYRENDYLLAITAAYGRLGQAAYL